VTSSWLVSVPWHQDVRLAAGTVPIVAPARTVEPELPAGDVWERMAVLHGAVADEVAAVVRGGGRPTVVSGDCLVSAGVLTGLQRAGLDPAVVWFDAHGDVHTLATSTSGYLGGLSLRLLLGADPDLLAGRLGLRPLAEERAVLVGARDVDPAEREFLAGSAVRQLDVDALDPDALPDGPLLLHVDVDVIDAGHLPGLLFPAPAGPSAEQVLDALARVVGTGRVVAVDAACTWRAGPDDGGVRAALLGRLAQL